MDTLLEAYTSTDEFRRARRELELGGPATAGRIRETERARLGGFCGGSLAFFLAARAEEARAAGHSLTLLVVSSPDEADEIADELDVFAPGRASVFPPWESLFIDGDLPDPTVCGERLALLDLLLGRRRERDVVIAPVQALIQPVPPPGELAKTRISLRRGEDQSQEHLAATFVDKGFRNVPIVERPGEFSIRGDIVDVFPYSSERPLRLELFGDSVDSLREFSPTTQRSLPDSETDAVDILLPATADVFREAWTGTESLLFDYLEAAADRVIVWEQKEVARRTRKIYDNIEHEDAEAWRDAFLERFEGLVTAELGNLPLVGEGGGGGLTLDFGTVESLRSTETGRVFELLAQRAGAGETLWIYCENDAEAKRFGELLVDHGVEASGDDAAGAIDVTVGSLRRGFTVRALAHSVLTSRELFNRRLVRRVRRRAADDGQAIQSFLELERGDFVVHLVHGIGRYLGIEVFERDKVEQEFLTLQFRNEVKVYVPVSKIELVQKYIGSGDKMPVLDKVGGTAWAKKKDAVENALQDMASELLDVQSERMAKPGHAYGEDSEWQREFEASFPFEDTPDQVTVTEALKEDLQRARPMDRLICGDVGYGKTELAMRAAFKVVEGGRQVAVLVPTTLLAEQHFRSFRERMAEFPVTIEVLSRFRSKGQQRAIVQRAADGAIDILIGTHRLLSQDVEFQNLGMVIIDEEQRFGVQHKERLKQLRTQVEVLTLSATPIPRTLHMALLGIRDISSLTTAPEGRAAIHTELCHWDEKRIRETIVRELNRDGQVYFVHNRVNDIDIVCRDLEMIVPDARIDVGHGQMNEGALEEVMHRFLEGETDVLLATTIIESGIDIPTANTMIIHEADRYGLADLHQLRGRVGRSKHQAYCYLVLPERRHVSPDARKRLQSLVEFSGLGSGFQIAMRDLEIRGAGNILGKEQSGHIATVGYDLYCRLLDKCVKMLKNETYHEPATVEVDLALEAYISEDFLTDQRAKIELYRRIASTSEVAALDDLRVELADRYGKLPAGLLLLFEVHELRLRCGAHGIEQVSIEEGNLILRGSERMQGLLASCPLRVVVLDGRTAAVVLRDWFGPPRQGAPIDRPVFDLLLAWLRTGEFPARRSGRRRFVDISE